MHWYRTFNFTFLLALSGIVLASSFTLAQDDDDDDVPPPPAPGGVRIDAAGVFKSKFRYDATGEIDRQRFLAAQSVLNTDIQKPSELRKISLNRLEAAYRKCVETGQPIPPEMEYLAGITRLTHVFYFPESKDVVIAGPAEGFYRSSQDRIVGMGSGKAVLRLDDLIVALRAYAPDGKTANVISCSIDPTQQGLANLNQAVKDVKAQVGSVNLQNPDHINQIATYYQQAMGYQDITIQGVSPRTHFAQVLVDADYHMKLIGIGLERAPVDIISFIDVATAGSTRNLQRWYFQPKYDYVTVSKDRLSMKMEGGAVKLVAEDEAVSNDGARKRQGKANRASQAFVNSFTELYDALADKMTLYAELRNVIDMSVAAAFIQQRDFYRQANWNMSFFGDESKFSVEKYTAPTKIEPAINAVFKQGQLLTPIGGGVNIQPRVALSRDRIKVDQDGAIDKTKRSITVGEKSNWWWD